MTIVELIEKIKSENISVQYLHQATEKIQTMRNETTKITFITEAVSASNWNENDATKIGLVLWCDKAAYKNAIEQIKKEKAK